MKSRSEVRGAGGQQKMEGVNMPASFKFAWRWLVGATAATILCLAALPGVGRAENIEICVDSNGKIKGINLGVGGCTGGTAELDWVTYRTDRTHRHARRGRRSRTGRHPGTPRLPRAFRDLRVRRERRDRKVLRARSDRRDRQDLQASWVQMESVGRPGWSATLDQLDHPAHPVSGAEYIRLHRWLARYVGWPRERRSVGK